jgi:hypothetical protein
MLIPQKTRLRLRFSEPHSFVLNGRDIYHNRILHKTTKLKTMILTILTMKANKLIKIMIAKILNAIIIRNNRLFLRPFLFNLNCKSVNLLLVRSLVGLKFRSFVGPMPWFSVCTESRFFVVTKSQCFVVTKS